MSATTTDQGEPKSTKWIVAWIARAITYLLYAYVLIVEIVLLVGFLLKLFGASRASGFVDWWYRHLEDVMEPFSGIFGSIELGTTSNDVPAVFETSILFAMVIYGIVAIALHSLISWISGFIHRMEQRQLEAERRQAYEEAVIRARAPYDPTAPQPPVPPYPGAPGAPGVPGPSSGPGDPTGAARPAPPPESPPWPPDAGQGPRG